MSAPEGMFQKYTLLYYRFKFKEKDPGPDHDKKSIKSNASKDQFPVDVLELMLFNNTSNSTDYEKFNTADELSNPCKAIESGKPNVMFVFNCIN